MGKSEVPDHADHHVALQDVHQPRPPLAAPVDQPVLHHLRHLLHRLVHRPDRTSGRVHRAVPSNGGSAECDDVVSPVGRWVGAPPGHQEVLLLGKTNATSSTSKVSQVSWSAAQCQRGGCWWWWWWWWWWATQRRREEGEGGAEEEEDSSCKVVTSSLLMNDE